ncbi:hypothetical protein CNMCM8980_002750 [Aspergillus fumigatiaffinis]|uniref:Carboxylic ester hydrolase n=1 Tax=Aspergillus fumigatiaffinis TaxID=340414 RepID=A0A8H4M312_9EURO|nr:hypothetical protein CNMCM6457_002969 [Aspergillus fumigatiaffinis]KAF4227357.1 hypothetical protein CNMCM6805_003093 [Aspergillus fumigatiaffinis]KAF4236777.1 hypothetical protein CNMCM8980_002750 [Aspergillus fumigatiaffinis]
MALRGIWSQLQDFSLSAPPARGFVGLVLYHVDAFIPVISAGGPRVNHRGICEFLSLFGLPFDEMAYPVVAASLCAQSVVPTPSTLPDVTVLGVSAIPVLNYTGYSPAEYAYNHPSITAENIDFCNITISYTHNGEGDHINIETWLPLDTWNGRLQAVGGGGWVAGRFPLSYFSMNGAIAQGYVTTTTDAGLLDPNGQIVYTPDSWALNSNGTANLVALKNLASVSLGDQAVIVKELIKNFYGRGPDYSYWSGCSQGGRQGLMLAQQYPDAYDGIAASAPAIYWSQFFAASIWGQVVMNNLGAEVPANCEFDYITDQFIAACDALDGDKDGLVSFNDESTCPFDPFALVGTEIECHDTNATRIVSLAAAQVANATWTGPRVPLTDQFLWYGLNRDSRLTGDASNGVSTTSDLGYDQVTCANGTCVGVPVGFGDKWFQYFVKQNASWSWAELTIETFSELFIQAVREYDAIIGTANPDLTAFHNAGGKLIGYHGLADGLIPFKGSVAYYEQVLNIHPNAQDFYRVFPVPGLGHCSGGNGGQPTAVWEALVAWVENATAPASLPISFTDIYGVSRNRTLCPLPQQPTLQPGFCPNSTSADAWSCK